MMFSLVTGLPSAASVTDVPIDVVRRLRRYYADVRLLANVHARITLLASRAGPSPVGSGRRRGLSVLARAISWLAYGSLTTPDPWELAVSFLPVLPARYDHAVGFRNSFFEAQFLARQCLCLRFTQLLAKLGARLEVKMVRYSFLVGLFHPRLHAGLSRRFRSLTLPAQF